LSEDHATKGANLAYAIHYSVEHEMKPSDIHGPYDDCRWVWVTADGSEMGWFTDEAKEKADWLDDGGHFRALTQGEINSMNDWYNRLAHEQS
ncbi:MAG TPA: hypothetical protein VJ837_06140, partial [Candidatus Paceibacterota bacterium]|nr:hypothetical protein [Candidatus Paceibacterota bacterium]